MAIQPLTAAELAAARLRVIARDLILEAEALEASVPREKSKSGPIYFTDPDTGKRTRIKTIKM